MKTPSAHQWSFGIQRQILRDTVIDVTYEAGAPTTCSEPTT
jgi:hypothetical protein